VETIKNRMLHYIQLKAEVREYGFGLWPRLNAGYDDSAAEAAYAAP